MWKTMAFFRMTGRHGWKLLISAAALILLCLVSPLWAENGPERILEYRSRLIVNPDGWVDVTETMTVLARRQQIRRGIVRQLPLTYRDEENRRIRMAFELISVTLDGQPEPVSLDESFRQAVMRIGSEQRLVSSGVHRYEIRYRLNRLVTFAETHDEIYWNVTGNDVAFPIDRVICSVELPGGAEIGDVAVWTGTYGSVEKDADSVISGKSACFESRRALAPQEGMTVAVMWPKGVITPPVPTLAERIGFLPVQIGSLIWTSFVFFLLWYHYGRDPQKDTVIPRFYPPEGMSASASRYVLKRCLDSRGFAAGIISLAVKGLIRIRCDDVPGSRGKHRYWLERRDDTKKELLAPDEYQLFDMLMGASRRKLELGRNSCGELRSASQACQDELRKHYGACYHRNVKVGVAGIFMTLLPLGAALHAAGDPETAQTLLMVTVVSAVVLGIVISLFEELISNGRGVARWFGLVVILGMLGNGGWRILQGLQIPLDGSSGIAPLNFTLAMLNALIPTVFILLMGAPTPEGQALRTQLDGLALYIEMAEKDRMNLENPPDRTPELFERLLPYALALELEQKWGEAFAGMLIRQTADGEENYRSAWYSGSRALNLADLSSLSSEISRSLSGAMKTESSGAPVFGGGGTSGGHSGGGRGGGGTSGW